MLESDFLSLTRSLYPSPGALTHHITHTTLYFDRHNEKSGRLNFPPPTIYFFPFSSLSCFLSFFFLTTIDTIQLWISKTSVWKNNNHKTKCSGFSQGHTKGTISLRMHHQGVADRGTRLFCLIFMDVCID